MTQKTMAEVLAEHRIDHRHDTALHESCVCGRRWMMGPQLTVLVRVVAEVWKPRRGRYDPGNLYPTAKACLDGIVDAGLLVDDDWRHVEGPDMRHGGIGPAALVVKIYPA